MCEQKSRARVVRGGGRSSAGLIGIAGKSALLPTLMVAAFGASHASAGSVVDLGSAYVTGRVDAVTCFDACTERSANTSGNEYAATPYSEATTTLHLSTAPSMTAIATANAANGAGLSPNFLADSKAAVGLDYYFAILGPDDITLPVRILSSASMTITGDISDSSGAVAVNNVHIAIEGPGLLINRYAFIELERDKTGGLDVNEIDLLKTNTLYGVGMRIDASAHTGLNSPDTVISTSTMDPSFTIADSGGSYSAYHIAYSSGIGGLSTVPLPASLPLFASALGGLGFVEWRRRRHSLSLFATGLGALGLFCRRRKKAAARAA
jgi:hypothetical protein